MVKISPLGCRAYCEHPLTVLNSSVNMDELERKRIPGLFAMILGLSPSRAIHCERKPPRALSSFCQTKTAVTDSGSMLVGMVVGAGAAIDAEGGGLGRDAADADGAAEAGAGVGFGGSKEDGDWQAGNWRTNRRYQHAT